MQQEVLVTPRQAALLTPRQTASYLNIGRTRCYRWLSENRLPKIAMGRSIRIPLAALEKWVEENTIEPM